MSDRTALAAGGLRRREVFRHVLSALSVGVLALPALGCGLVAPPVEETRTSTIAHVAGAPISVESENGAISVEASPSAKEVTVVAKVRATSRERLAATRVLAERAADGPLKIYVTWPGKREGSEGCSFEITVPDVRGVTLHSSNGALSLAGSSGPADLHTSNGRITVMSHDGDAKLKSSNGAISGERITGSVDAETSNGKITLTLAPSSPGPVDLESSNGAIELVVGGAFVGELSIKTSNGSLTLPERDGVRTVDRQKRSATLVFGQDGKPSTIRTSNGGVTIKVQD